MISNYRKNCMGTVSFDGKFPGMRKAQDFIVYPMKDSADSALIQSDTRIGRISMETGEIVMSAPRSGGAYNVHLMTAQLIGKLAAEDLLVLKANICTTASAKAGTNGIMYCDNSAAANVLTA